MTIQVFEHGDGDWRARRAGKGYKSVFGRSLTGVLGRFLWEKQYEFQNIDGVVIEIRFADGKRQAYDKDGGHVWE